jgi:transposase
MPAPTDLPNMSAEAPDVDELRAWMGRMIKALRFAELVAVIVGFLVRVKKLNTDLARQVAHLKRRRPPSETLARLECQLVLAFPGLVRAAPKPKERKPPRRGKHPGREALPAHLPRVPEFNVVPPEMRICPVCGTEMVPVGRPSICETLDLRPAEFFVRERHDETVACPNDDTIVSAPVPPELVPRGKLARGLIVEALLDKYVEHLPLERQCTRWDRAGVHVPSQTLGRSVAIAIDTLEPLAKIIEQQTRAAAMLAADASGLRVLDREEPTGARTGTIWCWIGDARWVTFVFTPEADAAGFKSFLGGALARTIQCDGTSVTNCIESAGGKRPGCWAHARRRFVEAARSGDLDALDGLRIIRKLFAVERLADIRGLAVDTRRAVRLEHSKKVLDELRVWLDDKRAGVPPKTPLGKAVGYLHRQWRRLVLFLDDGRIELTNNRVERELRRLVLGRKNWLFVEGDLNGRRTATILTIIGTCVAQGIDPRAYLHLVTRLVVEKWPRARYAELLPAALASAHPDLCRFHLSIRRRPMLPRAP